MERGLDTEIDWSLFKFISRKDEWFVEGTECVCIFDYGEPRLHYKVEENSGMFRGYTNETFQGYDGDLPRLDEEGCTFDEFDIYLNGKLINDITYTELLRSMKINRIKIYNDKYL